MKTIENLSPKQLQTFLEATARLNIWVGAVRSGKSFVSLLKFLDYIRSGPPGDLMIIGKSQDTIKRNILTELQFLVGSDMRAYEGKREMRLWGRTIYLVGANDERASHKIQGSTLAGAYIDELTLIPESFWVMLLSRLSIPKAQLFATTNPDSPFHWVKRNILEREKEIDLKWWQFYLEDNPSLEENYKNNLKREYRGLWYQRYIEGKWVLAEGTVYDFFDPKLHCIDFPPSYNPIFYLVGVDYGTTNPCAFVLVGYNPNHFPNMWVEKEYYYDSAKHFRQKTDTEYANDLKIFIKDLRAPLKAIYLDPSAASFKLECQRQGIRNILDADNEVLDGIRFVSTLLSNGTLKIVKQCKKLIEEMGSYVWNTQAKERGEDVPNKQNDHCFVKNTPVLTSKGVQEIEKIQIGDEVVTPIGLKKVIKKFKHTVKETVILNVLGKKIICTPEHKFYTAKGWKKSLDLISSDIFLINIGESECKKSEYLTESSIDAIYPPKIFPIRDTLERIKQTVLKDLDTSIEMFGNSIMEIFPKDTIYITSTGIPETMILATSGLFHLLNTAPLLRQILRKSRKKIEEIIAPKYGLLQKNGTPPKKGDNGIKNMSLNHCHGLGESLIQRNVDFAKRSSPEKQREVGFVQIIARANGEDYLKLIMKAEYALFALKNLDVINIAETKRAQSLVAEKCTGKTDVYNLMIEGIHVFFAYNILTLNCNDALRYCTFSQFGKSLGNENRMTVDQLKELRRQAGIF